MAQDKFVKTLLVLIVVLLAANLLKGGLSSVESQAQAQNIRRDAVTTTKTYLRTVNGQAVVDLKDVTAVGDGRSFVVANPKGFMVYQVITE